MGALRAVAPITTAILVVVLVSLLDAQGTPPPTPLVLVSREGRRPVPTTILSGQELIALDDIASLFQVMVREDTLAGGITLTYKGRTIVMSADQPMASVNGRVVTLPAPATRSGRRWLVPVEFISRALAPIYDARIDLAAYVAATHRWRSAGAAGRWAHRRARASNPRDDRDHTGSAGHAHGRCDASDRARRCGRP